MQLVAGLSQQSALRVAPPHRVVAEPSGRSKRLPSVVLRATAAATSREWVGKDRAHTSTALKEWAVACEALGAGLQTVLFRKGGIKEPTFKPQVERFLLFPTSFHSDAALIQAPYVEKFKEALDFDPKAANAITLRHYAEVTGVWTTTDGRVVDALSDLHVWTPMFMDMRLKWRQNQPLTILELRCYELKDPVVLPSKEDYFGCFSWVDFSDALAGHGNFLQGARPALDDTQFAQRQALLRAAIPAIGARPLDLKH